MSRVTVFRQLVQQQYLTTYEAFITQFRRAAVELGDQVGDARLASLEVSSRQFDRWMAGELRTLPHPDACRVLEHLLGGPAAELFASPGDRDAQPTVVQVPGVVERSMSPSEDNPLEIVAHARELTAGNTDDAMLAFLATSLEGVVARYERDGPQRLRDEARSLRRLLHTLLDGRQPPRVRHELFRLTARTSGLLGYMAVNTGDFLLAEAYCTEAEELSRAIGDRVTEVWIAGTRSLCLYYAGRYGEADACALAAIERAPGSAQAIRLLVNGRARALGKIGDRTGVEEAISQALDLATQHEVPGGITSCISFEPYGNARTLANAVTAHVSLGNVGRVLQYADEIDELVETSESSWSRSLVRLDVATALLHKPSPDLERALSLGVEALRLCGATPIRSVWQRSHELRDRARRWRDHPAVREYDEQLHSWRSKPAALAVSQRRGL